MTVDRWTTEPIYKQLAAIFRAKIKSGELKPGDQLPSEPRLVQEYGVARDTARAAIRMLRDEKLVITLPGRGTFVPPKKT
jgi:GntR family transcriptional regulator